LELLKDYIASLNDFERGRLLGRIYGEIVKEIAISGATIAVSSSAGPGGTAAGVASSAARILHKLGVAGRAGFVGRFLPKLSAGFPYSTAAQAATKLDDIIAATGLSRKAADVFFEIRRANPDIDELSVFQKTMAAMKAEGKPLSTEETSIAFLKIQGRMFKEAAETGDYSKIWSYDRLRDRNTGFGDLITGMKLEAHHIGFKAEAEQIFKDLYQTDLPDHYLDDMMAVEISDVLHRGVGQQGTRSGYHNIASQIRGAIATDQGLSPTKRRYTPAERIQIILEPYEEMHLRHGSDLGIDFRDVKKAAEEALRRIGIDPDTAEAIPGFVP
ncbi:MAG: hypothetical protein AAFS11_07130, partial [Planctomycetota bacterium]